MIKAVSEHQKIFFSLAHIEQTPNKTFRGLLKLSKCQTKFFELCSQFSKCQNNILSFAHNLASDEKIF
ncbi:MAG: hypothetical protein D8B50_08695 [Prevotella sp.]|nr:MAG: hypothetical protein D8B50_08695 [Prevotella sp.]